MGIRCSTFFANGPSKDGVAVTYGDGVDVARTPG